VLAEHRAVDAIDLAGAPDWLHGELERAAAGNLKRVVRAAAEDWSAPQSTRRLLAVTETKTVWHPVGL
jgi:hypothetical protein